MNYTNDITQRKSVSGITIKIKGACICYKTRFQTIIALRSTEIEFTAVCDVEKVIIHARSILDGIDLAQEISTTLDEDNQGSLLIANFSRTTKRTRHMDTNILPYKIGWTMTYLF